MVDDSAETSTKLDVDAAGLSAVEGAVTGQLNDCCVDTIRNHVEHNPMMVCSKCKFIIKCFTDERAYNNYLVFCRSRRRPIVIGVIDGYHTCAFRSYDTFNR
jgi:hypothetical protein